MTSQRHRDFLDLRRGTAKERCPLSLDACWRLVPGLLCRYLKTPDLGKYHHREILESSLSEGLIDRWL